MDVRPLVICFEGIDGCGKGTQINKMMDWLSNKGRKVCRVVDPGEEASGQSIRKILLDKTIPLTPEQQALLYTAARISGRDVIAKRQQAGFDVMLDRWVMSTIVYQGMVQNVEMPLIWGLQDSFVKFQPDLYIVLDLPANVAKYRLVCADTKEGDPVPDMDRFESQGLAFAENLRKGYKLVGEDSPKCWIVDAEQNVEDVFADVLEACRLKIDGFEALEAQADVG
jgi:dTMP kinase